MPSCQLTSSGHTPVSNWPRKRFEAVSQSFDGIVIDQPFDNEEPIPIKIGFLLCAQSKHGSLFLGLKQPGVSARYPYSDDLPQFTDVLLTNAATAADQLHTLVHPAFGHLGIV